MRIKIRHYRCAAIPAAKIRHIVSLPEGNAVDVFMKIKEDYGPLAHNIRLFWNSIPDEGQGREDPTMAYVGIEMMSFDITTDILPVAGLVQTDPMDQAELHRADGALESELARWGLFCDTKTFEWRCYYEVAEPKRKNEEGNS